MGPLLVQTMEAFSVSDMTKIGGGLSACGVFFMFLGVMFFFDRRLMAMGNVMFLGGVLLLIGIQNTASFFFVRTRIAGSVCFFFGIAMVMWGWTVIGLLLEGFGFINLFGNFIPTALTWATHFGSKLPYVGPLFSGLNKILPFKKGAADDSDSAFPV